MTPSRWNQQGPKLVANDMAGDAGVGYSVALSRDGQAIVGGPSDNHGIGAAWVYVLAGGVWKQRQDKLVGTGAGGGFGPSQGTAVALSGDGKTAIVGGPRDDNDKYDSVGAAWVYEYSDNAWSQQGDKLTGDATRGSGLGSAVALSLDGNIAIVGGIDESASTGAAWVFQRKFRNNGEFLIWDMVCRLPCDAGEGAMFGSSVALSASGTTAIVGGWGDNDEVGAAWIFDCTNGVWKQTAKLIGRNAVGSSQQGCSVALSASGNTAIVGGWGDSSGVGAAWVYERSSNGQGPWKQQGEKLIGTGAVGAASQGCSVGLSEDSMSAIVGGLGDNNSMGAAWIFTRPGAEQPWSQQQGKLVGTDAVGLSSQGVAVAISKGRAIIGGWKDGSQAGASWHWTA
jgi:hypothetical protein